MVIASVIDIVRNILAPLTEGEVAAIDAAVAKGTPSDVPFHKSAVNFRKVVGNL